MLFEDLNYNGLQDEGEPPVTGVELCLDVNIGCTPVDEDGRFVIASGNDNPYVLLKQPKLEGGKVLYQHWSIYKSQKVIPAFEKIKEQVLDDIFRKSTLYTIDIFANQINQIGLIENENIKGLCPVDMETPGVYFAFEFGHIKTNGERHKGIEIGGKQYTLHKAPDNGTGIRLGFDDHGGLFFQFTMETGKWIFLDHLDFSYNDYATLRFFGIDPSLFYDSDGKLKTNVRDENWIAVKNVELFTGQILPLYMSCTGNPQGFVHTHVAIYPQLENPCLYLDYCE
ncbi:MAG: hypothetical protein A2Z16_01725 [Chloroflexi bacterium RBG_16_54_18]|nr:MAG: hypothetical protein A2Z16_01725 [Chloroflexi bacterium RBG_16_54_18]